MSSPGEGDRSPFPLDEAERAELLAIARRAVSAYLGGEGIRKEPPSSETLLAPGAAFVTLTLEGSLRGCIGYTEAKSPLYRTVQECAIAAATEDLRFPPVTRDEVGKVRFEISVLSPLFPVSPGEIAVGTHGLAIRKGMHRGLLLPQVAALHGWNLETFLSRLCAKAGLPGDAWREEVELYFFTAEVFGE